MKPLKRNPLLTFQNRMKPFLGMTCKSTIDSRITDSILRFMHDPVKDVELHITQGEGFVGRARNKYTAEFIKGDCTDLINIDSDMGFGKPHVERLLSHDVDIVGGVYYKKQYERVPVMEIISDTKPVVREDGLLEVRYMGTGFLRVRRKVFEAMVEKYDIWYNHEGDGSIEWDFWPCTIDKEQRRYLSEDWWFCHRAKELGFKVWADTKCVVPHVGTAIYPIRQPGELCIDTGTEKPA